MPTTTPEIKVQAVRALGEEVLLHGDTYDDACDEALRLVDERDAVFVHAYDDVDVIAGQGTVAVEILEQHPEPIDAIFVPVGGGGLLAGVLAYIKSMRPDTAIIGVEPSDAACLHATLEAGEPVPLDHVGIFADGVAVRQVGTEPFRIVNGRCDTSSASSACRPRSLNRSMPASRISFSQERSAPGRPERVASKSSTKASVLEVELPISGHRLIEFGVAIFFQLQRQFLAAGALNPAMRQHMHLIGHDVIQQPLVMGDDQHRTIRRA